LIECELQSIIVLNEICKFSLKDKQKMILTKALFSSKILFYQKRINDILVLGERSIKERTLSKLRYDSLLKVNVIDYFGGEINSNIA
jgi:hypothetical protein